VLPVSTPERSLGELKQITEEGDQRIPHKRLAVVHALRHAWKSYERVAFGADEWKPIAGVRTNGYGLGLMIVDSLDTLWMAGLREEFERAVGWVRSSMRVNGGNRISFFETTIRVLGGLLSAYELSGQEVLLEKASDLGHRLIKAFEAPSGLPYTQINLQTGQHAMPSWLGGNLLLAEVGTSQMEFIALSKHTGDNSLRQKAEKVFDVLDREGGPLSPQGGRMWPIHIRPESGKPHGSTYSWGAMGDSYYEYLLKTWLLTGKRKEQYKRMYLESVRAMIDKLVIVEDGLTYVAEIKNGRLEKKMDHLVCFVPGMLALGAQHIPEVHDEHMDLAKRLVRTCYEMYARQTTGLAPEYVRFNGQMSVVNGGTHNLLRPEAIESVFYLYRFTRDPMYRKWGWRMFLAFETHCRVASGGYVGVKDVNKPSSPKNDNMETFFLAETLKYFLLLFSDDGALDLGAHVLNTEAHPLQVLPEG